MLTIDQLLKHQFTTTHNYLGEAYYTKCVIITIMELLLLLEEEDEAAAATVAVNHRNLRPLS